MLWQSWKKGWKQLPTFLETVIYLPSKWLYVHFVIDRFLSYFVCFSYTEVTFNMFFFWLIKISSRFFRNYKNNEATTMKIGGHIEVENWIVKTTINSKQQCWKQKLEFWRGYNAIIYCFPIFVEARNFGWWRRRIAWELWHDFWTVAILNLRLSLPDFPPN